MSSLTENRVAFYKLMPSSNIPHRKGPLQTIRSCQNCIRKQRDPLDDDLDEILKFMSFDDLIIRKSIWFSPYQSIQYHIGQFEIITRALQNNNRDIMFIVAQTSPSDINYLDQALKYSISNEIQLDVVKTEIDMMVVEPNHFKTIPILYQSCPIGVRTNDLLFGPSKLDNLLKPIMDSVIGHDESDTQVVVAVITKDHDKRRCFPGLGTVCIQMLEPFSIRDYVKNSLTNYPSTHLVKHIYSNVAQSAPILAPNLIAFLLLYLDREEGVTFEDLLQYTEWFWNSAIDNNMQLGFTGETKSVVEFGLLILDSFIYKSKRQFKPKDFESLTCYAYPVVPLIAYQGIISRAILIEHNKNSLLIDIVLKPEVPVRVARDDVLSTSKLIAENLELIVPLRKPCVEIEVMISQELSKMELSGRYLSIQEPKINTTQKSRTFWAGEEDSDDDYYAMNKDKDAFKTWIQLTNDHQKLDRLNLFINAIEHSINVAILDIE